MIYEYVWFYVDNVDKCFFNPQKNTNWDGVILCSSGLKTLESGVDLYPEA